MEMDTRWSTVLTSAQWDVLDGLVKKHDLQGTRAVLKNMLYVVEYLLDEIKTEDFTAVPGDPANCPGNPEEMCLDCENEPQCFPHHF